MSAYYNEIDPFAAQWLRNLIAADLIAPGDVDERSIVDVSPDDLAGYTQAHFFAGIGVWSYALRLAGWPDDRLVWTGSCPCQPFSSAGKGDGAADPRHLWPAWFRLIRERRPHALLGEQVSGVDGLAWLDLVHADLEACDYAVGAVTLPAASVGAPHQRHRIFWVADAGRLQRARRSPESGEAEGGRAFGDASGRGDARLVGDASSARPQGLAGHGDDGHEPRRDGTDATGSTRAAGATRGFWADAEWLYCRDGKYRPVEPGTFPLAHGAPARVGRLRGYGNAINAEVAAAFIRAYREVRP